jgi:hypothetical protein
MTLEKRMIDTPQSASIQLNRSRIAHELQVCYLFEQIGYTVGVDRDNVATISWDAFVGDWWK